MPSLDDYAWLVSPEAVPWLNQTAKATASLLAQTKTLRAALSPERTHLILEQAELRQRGRDKFADAERMFFTRVGLEQATDEITAGYKATRFPAGSLVADLCCGIGGDLRALATRGATLGVDRDPAVAILAQHNSKLRTLDSSVICTDVVALNVGECFAWHLDPDRRPSGQRTTRVELYEPGPAVVARLRGEQPSGAIKLAPAAIVPDDWPTTAELEWISRRGECRQQVAWFGQLAQSVGQRRATILGDTSKPLGSVVGQPDLLWRTAERVGAYLYEADAAVLAARLTGQLAAELNLSAIDPHGGYLTTDQRVNHAALVGFAVRDVLPFDRKRLRVYCREQKLGRLEVKKRGVDVDPAKLIRELAADGPNPAVILLAPFRGENIVIVAERVKGREMKSAK